MATVYEIIQGLSQAAANAYDGAMTEDGKPLEAGLKREEGDALIDRRWMASMSSSMVTSCASLTCQR